MIARTSRSLSIGVLPPCNTQCRCWHQCGGSVSLYTSPKLDEQQLQSDLIACRTNCCGMTCACYTVHETKKKEAVCMYQLIITSSTCTRGGHREEIRKPEEKNGNEPRRFAPAAVHALLANGPRGAMDAEAWHFLSRICCGRRRLRDAAGGGGGGHVCICLTCV